MENSFKPKSSTKSSEKKRSAKKARLEDEPTERLESGVSTPIKSPSEKAAKPKKKRVVAIRKLMQREEPSEQSTEDEESFSHQSDDSDASPPPPYDGELHGTTIQPEDETLAEQFCFKAEWLRTVALNCPVEVYGGILMLLRELQKRSEVADQARRANHTWGITSQHVAQADNLHHELHGAPLPAPKRARVAPATVVAMGMPRTELLQAKFSAAQMNNFIAHLRASALANTEDDRFRLLTSGAIKTITTFFVSRDLVGEVEPDTWLDWGAMDLAEKLQSSFENPDATITRSCVDWLPLMEKECRIVLNVRIQDTFLHYCQCILQVEQDAMTKESPEKAVVEALLAGLVKGSDVPKANRTLHSRLKARKDTLVTIQAYTVAITKMCMEARKSVEEADQWETRQTGGKDRRQKGDTSPIAGANPAKAPRFLCNGCGNPEARSSGHICKQCAGHPDRNQSGPWKESATFRTLRDRLPGLREPQLLGNYRANGEPLSETQKTEREAQKAALRASAPAKDATSSKSSSNRRPSGKPGNQRVTKGENLNNLSVTQLDTHLVPCTISCNNGKSLTVQALVDTGALDENYASLEVAEWIRQETESGGSNCVIPEAVANSHAIISLGGSLSTFKAKGVVVCDLTFINEITSKHEKLSCLQFRVIPSQIDLIIGLHTIKVYGLVKKLERFFTNGDDDPWKFEATNGAIPTLNLEANSSYEEISFSGSTNRNTIINNRLTRNVHSDTMKSCQNDDWNCPSAETDTKLCEINLRHESTKVPNWRQNWETPSESQSRVFAIKNSKIQNDARLAPAPVIEGRNDDYCSCVQLKSCYLQKDGICDPNKDISMESIHSWRFPVPKPNQTANHQLCSLSSRSESNIEVFDNILDDDEVVWKDDPFDAENCDPPNVLIEKINVFGSEQLQTKIKSLCYEYQDIFSEVVRTEPARVPPMEIAVDSNKWYSNKNRGPPRPQSDIRQAAIKTQVNKYLDLGVIKPSKASEYSQVHLVPKGEPNEWRFCLDYVRLNEATLGVEGWPIPNIPQMIQRIGSKKPTVFGVMDMTSGYHQAPLSAAARLFTAFICFMGVFEWLRVPMGTKNAGSYFQRVMATTVLVGLLYVCCELYIDDVVVYGENDDAFVDNLKTVFQRFRQHNITLNPKKCKLGLDKVEFVGHVISEEGITFSDEKRLKVLNFPLPTKGKQLLGFLGLVNYFRDHLPDMTGKTKGLRALVTNIRAPIIWTPELEAQFYTVRDTVARCPALFFLSVDGEVVVMTDASDYGIGAYIYQIVDGKERPILFLSKALHGAQLNWSTIEKEAYAIFYTLKTHDHLLRDIQFTLRTDHKNLTYINLESSQKVRRWKLFLQDFNFRMEHVAGTDNTIADAFSRLCSISSAADEETFDNRLFLLETTESVRIPAPEYKKISKVHNSRVGHFGVEKTLDALREKNESWKHMRKHVRKFIQQCPICQVTSDKKLAVKVAPFTRAAYEPMEVLNIDAIGPLPEDESKNTYILVVIDCFSRWVELFGVPDTSALSAAKVLIQHCGRFGIPALIRSDRGSQFVNELIENLVTLLGTEQELTTAYSKEENAIVERANKEVMRHLRAIVFDDRVYNNWSTLQLPLVMRILNSEQKSRTGVSPAEILFGNAVDLGRYLLHRPTSSPNPNRDLHDHLEQMLEKQRTFIEVAQKTQRDFDTHHMSQFDPDFTDYPIESYVLWENPAGSRSKVHAKLQGPYQVVSRIADTYTIQDLVSSKTYDTHISNLRPFNVDHENHNPVEVAQHNSQEFVIDTILEHQGDRNRRSTMSFKVHWKGYGPEEDSWEPYSYLRDTDQLHTYLRANRMLSLIPQKFRVQDP